MENKLVLAVLLATLAWLSASTGVRAQSNCTMVNGTMMGDNCTVTNETVSTNMTSPNATAVPTNATGPNATAVPTNATGPNATAVPATPPSNPDTTGVPATAAPPPLTPDLTVTPLVDPITSEGCSTEKLCASVPASCNPAESDTCTFTGIKSLGGLNFAFELAGPSEGYIANTLSTDSTLGNRDPTLACAKNVETAEFFSAVLVGTELISEELNVNNVKARVVGNKIECTFDLTVPDSQTRAGALVLALSSGSYDPDSGTLGSPTILLKSPPVNLNDPNTVVENQVSGHATALQQPLLLALLLSVGVLSLAVL